MLLFFLMIARDPVHGQQAIEKYLVTERLVDPSQLKEYKDKEKADDQYVRLMIKLMKRERGVSGYKREMEKEYKEELKNKEQNNDTLSILADILEVTRAQRPYPVPTIPQLDTSDVTNSTVAPAIIEYRVNDQDQVLVLTHYVLLLRSKRLISDASVKKLSEHVSNDRIYDSMGIVKNAIGFRQKEILTSRPRLVELMNLLKDIDVLSKEKYEQLINETIPDSINKIFHIVSHSEHVLFLPTEYFFIKDKKEFDKLIAALSKLTGIEVADPSIRFVEISNDERSMRGFNTMELYHNGKRFFEEGNEISFYQKSEGIYPLYHHSFYKIFNKILIAKNSPYRVHEIKEKNPSDYIYTSWSGYILLNRIQSKKLYRNENIEISYEENIDPLSRENILKAIERYKEVGWFSKLSQSYIDSVLEDIKVNPVYRYNELVSRFKLISLTINERIPLSQEELITQIRSYARLSDGAFDFQNIRFVKNSTGKTKIEFESNNKTYSSDFDMPWMNAWHITHNAVFSDDDRTGQFAVLRIGQHLETYIYLTHKQRNILEKERLIGDW